MVQIRLGLIESKVGYENILMLLAHIPNRFR